MDSPRPPAASAQRDGGAQSAAAEGEVDRPSAPTRTSRTEHRVTVAGVLTKPEGPTPPSAVVDKRQNQLSKAPVPPPHRIASPGPATPSGATSPAMLHIPRAGEAVPRQESPAGPALLPRRSNTPVPPPHRAGSPLPVPPPRYASSPVGNRISKLMNRTTLPPTSPRSIRLTQPPGGTGDEPEPSTTVDVDGIEKAPGEGFKEEPAAARPGNRGAPADRSKRTSALIGKNLTRTKSLSRPERAPRPQKKPPPGKSADEVADAWRVCSWVSTLWALPYLLKAIGKMDNYHTQQAWREKVTLVILITILCGALAFITFGLNVALCTAKTNTFMASDIAKYTTTTFPHRLAVRGHLYEFRDPIRGMHTEVLSKIDSNVSAAVGTATGVDVSIHFPPADTSCSVLAVKQFSVSCTHPSFGVTYCHKVHPSAAPMRNYLLGEIAYQWSDIQQPTDGRKRFAYNGIVLDVTQYLADNNSFLGQWAHDAIVESVGTDASIRFGANSATRDAAACLQSLYTAGVVDTQTVGCFISDIILNIALVVILTVVLLKFFLAIAFSWFMSRELGRLQEKRKAIYPNRDRGNKLPALVRSRSRENVDGASKGMSRSSSYDAFHARQAPTAPSISRPGASVAPAAVVLPNPVQTTDSFAANRVGAPEGPGLAGNPTFAIARDLRNIHTILLVTCYSEGEDSLRCTLDSLTLTDYPVEYKLLVIISDGLVKGEGSKITPDLIIDMLELDPSFPRTPEPVSYIAIADGKKVHNKAQVYVGIYRCQDKHVKTVLIVKCGTEAEKNEKKPGNRGKRDSQVILMSFFQKVIFNEGMTPLEYDLFRKIQYLTNVTADAYEIVLMVDADTKVMPDSLTRMVLCMARDPQVMGLCGETRIANKGDTWVTRIQVFEYHISHHLGKAFESIFGGVTCLPGCFCMYRIKAPKGEGNFWVPVIANPAIIEEYRVNVVDTLHKKNLLLLGEDRYLTTLMLRTFPKRKMIFVPKAVCRTVVPDRLSILMSQRRRWINSTIHNLFELLFVRELCGTFCFSMQFIVFLELIGTLTLPAAITFTTVLIVMTIIGPVIPVVPLLLLFAILGLPAFLILLTTRKAIYVYWMAIYLCALPIWNFLLPAYAYWHFDDFSWGITRVVAGDKGGGDHGAKEGEFDPKSIPCKKWAEWERERRKMAMGLGSRKTDEAEMMGGGESPASPTDPETAEAAALGEEERRTDAARTEVS